MTDFYKLGTEVDEEEDFTIPPMKRQIRGNYRVGASLIATPADLLAEMNTVKTQVETLDRDIRSSEVRPVFLSSWDTFKQEWDTFYKDHEGWFARFMESGTWGAATEKIVSYSKRANDWRDAFTKEGGKPTGPKTEATKGVNWNLILWGVGIVAGLTATAVIVKEVGSTVRSFKGSEG